MCVCVCVCTDPDNNYYVFKLITSLQHALNLSRDAQTSHRLSYLCDVARYVMSLL